MLKQGESWTNKWDYKHVFMRILRNACLLQKTYLTECRKVFYNPTDINQKSDKYNNHRHIKRMSRHGARPWRTRSLRVLVDMDGVLCDFEGHFLKVFRETYPEDPYVPLHKRKGFYVDVQYRDLAKGLEIKAKDIIESEGFFQNLPPIPGAIQALKEMSGMEGVDVFICSSPLTHSTHSVKEKFEWVMEHIGYDWIGRTILTRDKTMIAGDILIDDRPRIRGVVATPSWDHILFTSCHNRHLDLSKYTCTKRLDDWTDSPWQDIIEEYKRKL